MRKKFFSVALIALSVFAFSSCNDDDDNNDNTGTIPSAPPVTSSEATALVNAIYGPLQTLSSSYSFLVESATETTVSFEGNDQAGGPLVSKLEVQKDNSYAMKVFNRLYLSISLANKAIEDINAIPVSDQLNQEGKDLLIGRAQFIRGYDYFQLVQLYGEVPVYLSSTPTATDSHTRKSIEEVYAQIVSDLEAAIAKLPLSDSNKSNPSQLAAKTILAKAYLTWGQKPLTQDQVAAIVTSKTDPAKPAVDNAKLKQAIAYANEVINSGQYRLLDDYNNIWGVPNENNAEVIFSIHHDGDDQGDAQGNHQTHCGYTFPGNEWADPHIQYADISLENLIPAGDARRLYSYATKTEFANSTNSDTLTWPISVVRPGKWIHRNPTTGKALASQPNNIDHIDFRLAEVYLIKAEAQWYAGDGDKGLSAINALRTRAGVASLSTISEDAIQKEWSYELAFEQKHWINLLRWRTLIASIDKVKGYEYYKEAYNDKTAFNALPGAIESRFTFYQRIYQHLHLKVANINGHNYRFPIPKVDASTESGITPQNPGYNN
ncbi:MAG: RagB/SusD family nutrient uptake outer membrane protein [Tannerella sp.]|jgi:hypothetical protein|nr:RagB/SusD family nutrient uptake outer membrane protein [Tannerella sp.]